MPSSGTAFHSLQATSQALHPMHTEVSVKKPIRGGWSTWPARAAGSMVNSHLRAGVVGNACPPRVLVHQPPQRGPARPASRADIAGQRLHLLDVHVRVESQVGQVVRGVAGGQAVGTP